MYSTGNDYREDRVVAGLRALAAEDPTHHGLLLAAAETIAGPDLVVDLTKNTITLGGQLIKLQPTEVEIMEVLKRGVQTPTHVIVEKVWPYVQEPEKPTKTLSVFINQLNRKMAHVPYRIISEWGQGYQLRRIEDNGNP